MKSEYIKPVAEVVEFQPVEEIATFDLGNFSLLADDEEW